MKLALVTGISRGLGFAIAKQLLQSGYSVIGLGHTDHPELDTAARIHATTYKFFKMDLRDFASIETSMSDVHSLVTQSKEIESLTLVNNAAVTTPVGLLKNLTTSDIQESLSVNLIGPIVLSKAFISKFEKLNARKRIIHLTSIAANTPLPGQNIYSISKAGLEMLVKAIHSESQYLASPIECIGFNPGLVDTDMQTLLRERSPSELPIVANYLEFKGKGLLRVPDAVAKVLLSKLIDQRIESGRIYPMEDLSIATSCF